MKIYRCHKLFDGIDETDDGFYIPNKGVLLRHSFYVSKEVIAMVESAMNSPENRNNKTGSSNFKEFEVPDDIVSKIVSAAKDLNRAKRTFQEAERMFIKSL